MRQKNNVASELNKRRRSMTVLCVFLLMMLIAGLCAACTKTEVAETAALDLKEQITSFAWEVINRDIENYESNPEVKITESKITRLELVETFDVLSDTPIEVYALEYRLLPEDLSKVVLAGGMDVDSEGWLKETCSMGSPLLVTSNNNEEAELIGILWKGGVLEEGSLETAVKGLLNSK